MLCRLMLTKWTVDTSCSMLIRLKLPCKGTLNQIKKLCDQCTDGGVPTGHKVHPLWAMPMLKLPDSQHQISPFTIVQVGEGTDKLTSRAGQGKLQAKEDYGGRSCEDVLKLQWVWQWNV